MKMLPNVVLSVAALALAGPGQAQNPRPDLVITGITANASSIAVGDSVEYTVTAKNIGLAPCNLIKLRLAFPSALELTSARADSPLSCEFMDCSGGSFYVMWGGQSFSARYTLKAKSPGSHAVSATIDPDNVCSENKESNNGATAAPLTVTPPPLSPPRLRLTANQPSFRPTRDQPWQIFPLVITNVGEGTAVNFTLQWPVNLGDLGPTLQSVTRGHPAQAVPFDCTPAGTIPVVCTVRITLQPQQGVQANLRYAACINGVNPEIRVATAGDNTQENHTLRLNDACPRPDLAITALPVSPPASSLQTTQTFPLTITNNGPGPAADVALAWSPALANIGPTLVTAYLGPRTAPGQPQPPPLAFTCAPTGTPTLCTIPILLQPGQIIQADVRFATCRDLRTNATVRVSTPGEIRTDNQAVGLHAARRP